MEKERLGAKREILRMILRARFGSIPDAIEERIAAAEAALDRLLVRVVEE
jgi:hypothetical protein